MIVVDFETTGLLDPSADSWNVQPGIVEIGIVTLDNKFQVEETLNIRVNPEMAVWHPDAIATHGIKPEDVETAPTFPEAFQQMIHYFVGKSYWVGYNNEFDKRVLWYQLIRYGFSMNFPWPPKDIDVMKVAQTYLNIQGKKDTKPPRLVELYLSLFEKPMVDAHNAFADAMATARCLIEFSKRRLI